MANDDRGNKIVIREMLRNLKTGQAVQEQIRHTMNSISGHMREVLGPLSEVGDFVKNTFENVKGFVKGIGEDLGLFGAMSVEDEELPKQTGFLEKIVELLTGEQKEEFREGIGKGKLKKGWAKVLFFLGFFAYKLGELGGAIAKVIWLPFQVIIGVIKKLGRLFLFVTKPVWKLGKWFLRLPLRIKFIRNVFDRIHFWFFLLGLRLRVFLKESRTGRFLTAIGRFFKRIGGLFKHFKKVFVIFKPFRVIFNKFLKGFVKGFRTLGWPLQIILSVVDFISGYMKAEGGIGDKVIAGFKNVIYEFFKLPIQILGWITSKVWELVTGKKVDTKKLTDRMLGWFKDKIDLIFDIMKNPFNMLLKGIKWIWNWFTDLWNSVVDWLYERADEYGIGGIVRKVLDPETIKWEKPVMDDEVGMAQDGVGKLRSMAEAKKDEQIRKLIDNTARVEKALDKVKEDQKKGQANVVTAINTQTKTETKESPSSIDESLGIMMGLSF